MVDAFERVFLDFIMHPSRITFLTSSAAIAALLFSSCATTGERPSTTSSLPTPESWSQGDAQTTASLDTAALSGWWSQFQDPVLDQLIVDALANSPDIRTALSKIEQARAERKVERSSLFPSISAGVSGSGQKTRDHNAHTSTSSDSYSASLDASWEIDLFGKQRLSLAAATADLAQTQENYHAAQVSLAAEVATAYINLRSAESRLAIVRRTLETREETTQLTQWREQAGVGSALDSRQAVASLEQARASIPSLQQTLTETRNQLAILCGRIPGSLDTLIGEKASVPSVSSDIASGIPAETLRQRPDVRAAGYAVQAAAARSSSARRDRLPTLSLTGSLGVNAGEFGKLFSPETTVASLVGSLTAPIFTAGKITQNIRIQDELTKQTLISYESTVLTAYSEVENALSAIRRNRERIVSLETATSAAREADSLARHQYESGSTDFLTVLDSERTLLGLEETLVSTRADLSSAHIQLYKALGGGWSADSETSESASL